VCVWCGVCGVWCVLCVRYLCVRVSCVQYVSVVFVCEWVVFCVYVRVGLL